jgi:DNA-binding XRE family transcriptional regulator
MATKKHNALRLAIRGAGLTYETVADKLGISEQGLLGKLAGTIPWKLREAYMICQIINGTYSNIYELFPPEEQIITTTRRMEP